MKTYRRFLLRAMLPAVAILLSPLIRVDAQAPSTRESVKILTIGNSFADNALSFLPQLAASGGKKLVHFRANLGGCTLERHARHLGLALSKPEAPGARPYKNAPVLNLPGKQTVTLPEALTALDWDFVTIQQASHLSFLPETFEPHAQQIIAAIRKHAPRAEILIHQTWAYREDHELFTSTPDLNQDKMHAGLRAAYEALSERYGGLRILPSGDAFQAARQTIRWHYRQDTAFDFKNPPKGTLPDQRGSLVVGWQWSKKSDGHAPFRLDAKHANIAGRYLLGCVFYESLFGSDTRLLTFVPDGLAASDAADLRRIAHSVVLGKYEQAAAIADAIARPIATVVDKIAPPGSGDLHDYVSYARYYWPDPAKPSGLPYVARDGQHNEAQVALGDHARLWTFFNTVETLAAAWRDNRDAAAACRAGEWLRAWLVTPATRMNPNLEYAQVRLGHDDNRGSNYGIIDTRGFGQIIADIRTLRDSDALTSDDEAALCKWFSAYLDWLVTSRNGIAERAMKSNHGTWYVAQALPIARHVGRLDLARELCEETKARIAVQIAPDGSQPIDIKRVDGLGYSRFNLRAHAQIARAARELGIDLWNYTAPNGASLRLATAFLEPYNHAPENWPHNQKARLAPGFLDELLAERDSAAAR